MRNLILLVVVMGALFAVGNAQTGPNPWDLPGCCCFIWQDGTCTHFGCGLVGCEVSPQHRDGAGNVAFHFEDAERKAMKQELRRKVRPEGIYAPSPAPTPLTKKTT
jgi:hypothetical protein